MARRLTRWPLWAALATAAVLVVAGLAVALGGGLRGWALAAASHRLGRSVTVDGALGITPGAGGLTVRFTGLRVGDLLQVRQGSAVLPWTALLGDGRLKALSLDGVALSLRRDAAGRANWTGRGGAARPPQIGRLQIAHGVVDLTDLQHQLSFHGDFAEPAGAPLTLDGGGKARGDAWTLHATGAMPTGATPVPVAVRLGLAQPSGRSSFDLDGRFDGAAGRLSGKVRASGPDLHALAQILPTPLPRTPPYTLKGGLDVTAKQMRLQAISGRLGASDMGGDVTITPQPEGRRVDARMHSRSLRISDLFSVMSGGKLTGPKAPGRLLPDADINPKPLRQLVGQVDLTADSVQQPTVPAIRSLTLHATFDHGLVAADPMVFVLPRGRMVMRLALDTRRTPPRIRLAVALQDAAAGELKRPGAPASPLRAPVQADLHLTGDGWSLQAAAAAASGRLSVRVGAGMIQRVPVDVLSADLLDGALTVLGLKNNPAPLRCVAADFDIRHGQATAQRLKLSSEVGVVVGTGGLDLGRQTLDITLRREGGGATAVRVRGPLLKPDIAIAPDQPLKALGRAAGALLHLGRPKPPPEPCV